MTPEAQIQSEVELLRSRVEDTQELYREVCALLFFRFGITPTANKLYQYVKKGSMSAPAQALAKFWEDLRDKSRVRIENPDLPESLRTTAGELIGTLWKRALDSAQQELEVFRSESRAAVRDAAQDKQRCIQELEVKTNELERLQIRTKETESRLEQAQSALIEERTQKVALDAQLRVANARLSEAGQALADARQDFAKELDKIRQALVLAEERCQATEKRALLAIDQERTVSTQMQKELQQARQTAYAAEKRHQTEVQRYQDEQESARKKLATAEAMAESLRTTAAAQSAQLLQFGAKIAEKETRLEFLSKDLVNTQQLLSKTEAQLLRFRSPAKSRSNATLIKPQGLRRRKLAC